MAEKNAQAVQKLVLEISQTSNDVHDNGQSRRKRSRQIQKTTIHNGEFSRSQPSEKRLPIHTQLAPTKSRASAKKTLSLSFAKSQPESRPVAGIFHGGGAYLKKRDQKLNV